MFYIQRKRCMCVRVCVLSLDRRRSFFAHKKSYFIMNNKYKKKLKAL